MTRELTAPIAAGRTAEVYAWGDHEILKLYYDWCSPDWVTREQRAAAEVRAAGIPTPAVGERVEIRGRHGLVFERVSGSSLLDELNARPWRLLHNARALARLHVQINCLTVDGLPLYKDILAATICRSPRVPDPLREPALSALAALPGGAALCHGDFHPGNVLLTEQGPTVIDWMTVASGSPWADVARTSILLTAGVRATDLQLNPLFRLFSDLYHRAYLRAYRRRHPEGAELLERWLPVLAVARLDEGIAGEREVLVGMGEGLR